MNAQSVVVGSSRVGDQRVARVLEAGASGVLSPHAVINQLSAAGVDSYITTDGHLLVKYWQIAVSNFVSPEVAEVLQPVTKPPEVASLEWVGANLEALQQKYAGQWVAIAGGGVKAVAGDLGELLSKVKAAKIAEPFVTRIPVGEINWTTLFAHI